MPRIATAGGFKAHHRAEPKPHGRAEAIAVDYRERRHIDARPRPAPRRSGGARA